MQTIEKVENNSSCPDTVNEAGPPFGPAPPLDGPDSWPVLSEEFERTKQMHANASKRLRFVFPMFCTMSHFPHPIWVALTEMHFQNLMT